MSITITGKFSSPAAARQASERLRRRGYVVSTPEKTGGIVPPSPLVVAHPYGAVGGNTPGNGLLSALPIMAGNGLIAGGTEKKCFVSLLTDDTHATDARGLMESLGAKII